MEEAGAFARRYRAMIDTFSLPPEVAAQQLQRILWRVSLSPAFAAMQQPGAPTNERREKS